VSTPPKYASFDREQSKSPSLGNVSPRWQGSRAAEMHMDLQVAAMVSR
jgi:hypothetical protein